MAIGWRCIKLSASLLERGLPAKVVLKLLFLVTSLAPASPKKWKYADAYVLPNSQFDTLACAAF
jgi:hypothetical protein